MRYFLTGIILNLFGLYLIITPIEKLNEIFPKITSPSAAKIGGSISLIMGIFILVLQIGEWMKKL